MVPLLVIAGIILVGVVAYYSWLAEKKRREAMAALAAELGLSFAPARDRYSPSMLNGVSGTKSSPAEDGSVGANSGRTVSFSSATTLFDSTAWPGSSSRGCSPSAVR